MSNKFSAHKTPAEFIERVKEYRGLERYERLRVKAKQVRDKDYDKVKEYLVEETNKLIS